METMFNAVKGLITSKMVKTAAGMLGESEQKVSAAIPTILRTQIAALHRHASSAGVKEVVELAGKKNVLSHLPEIFGGDGIIGHVNVGERMENALMGSDSHSFTAEVAASSGLQKEHADRLSNWVAAALAAWAGEQVVAKKRSLASLFAAAPAAAAAAHKAGAAQSGKKKKCCGWLWWLVLALIAIALLLWLLRGCTACAPKATEPVAAETAAAWVVGADTTITLQDGSKFTVQNNSLEAQMVRFLQAGGYEKSTPEQLCHKWFHFTHIDFEMNSADKLVAGEQQLKNLSLVAKNFPATKVVIGGYADKTGTRLINKELSKARAEFVKGYFERIGVEQGRISTEGFGEQFATLPAEATDQQRAIDRHIAIRFAK